MAAPTDLDVLNFARSFVCGTKPINQVRLWVESRTRFIDQKRGIAEDYYQCAACKSEAIFHAEQIFKEDNYDFIPAFGPQFGIIFRNYAYLNDDYKSVQPIADMWGIESFSTIRSATKVRELPWSDGKAQVEAAHAGVPLVGRVAYGNDETGQRVVIDFPLKTINIRKQDDALQPDTGPILFADLSQPVDRAADAMHLAFCAFEGGDSCDFVIEQPTPLPQDKGGPAKVHHYSKLLRLETSNQLFAVDD